MERDSFAALGTGRLVFWHHRMAVRAGTLGGGNHGQGGRGHRDHDNDDDEKPPKKGSKCPHGHTFGKDIDKHPECEDCKKWDECEEASGE